MGIEAQQIKQDLLNKWNKFKSAEQNYNMSINKLKTAIKELKAHKDYTSVATTAEKKIITDLEKELE